MKRYTMQGAIHDARVFYQLWLEYRRANKKPRELRIPAAVPILAGTDHVRRLGTDLVKAIN